MLIVCPNTVSHGARISNETGGIDIGKVVEVIDGEVFKVYFYRRNFDLPSIEIVRVIGLDTEASFEAFKYASSRLLGKTVFFTYDDQVGRSSDGMTLAHVFLNYETTYAEEILSLGYGVVDDSFKGNIYQYELEAAEYSAELYELGRWETSLSQTTDRININTATRDLLKDSLGLTDGQALSIVSYREHNNYNDIFEVMAADQSLDADWFDAHSHLMSVVTNLNKTSYLELSSLMPGFINKEIFIDDLVYYLKFNEVTSIQQVKDIPSISSYLEAIESYITLDTTNVLEEPNKRVANVNTVDEDHFLQVTGLSEAAFKHLLEIRDNGSHVVTTLTELYKKDEVYNKVTAYIHSDHLSTLTDVNTAGIFELETVLDMIDLSLYEQLQLAQKIVDRRPYYSKAAFESVVGSDIYHLIETYIYVNKDAIDDRYNPNTASSDALEALDIKYNGQTSNYTNVNVASKEVLLDLNEEMTLALVNDIIAYRKRYPFRNNDDLHQIFGSHNKWALYNRIAYYLSYE